jgi:hypothetical protein
MRTPSDKEANAPVFEIGHEFGEMLVAWDRLRGRFLSSTSQKAFACLAADSCVRGLHQNNRWQRPRKCRR